MEDSCQMCGRIPQNGTTRHHLIPKVCHKNKWFKKRFTREQMGETISVCRRCHNAIHLFIPNQKDLGRSFASLELLVQHEGIAGFLKWARKQS